MARLHQEYVSRVEEKILGLEVVDGKGVRVLGGGDDVVIPTTEELSEYVHEPKAYDDITAAEVNVVQLAEEKVAIAQQTYNLIDEVCNRLDMTLTDFEKALQVRVSWIYFGVLCLIFLILYLSLDSRLSLQHAGEFQAPGTAKPNDLAAINVIPGTPDWILAKVISFDAQTGMYKLSDEDTESNKSKSRPLTFAKLEMGMLLAYTLSY